LRPLHWRWHFIANAVLNNYSNLHNDFYEGIIMVRIVQILVLAKTIIRAVLKRFGILLLLLSPITVGCDEDEAARREREHVNAMQRQVTEASKGLVTADAEARKGWVAAQQSFEQTRKSIVQQQTDIQSGLDRLELERKSIATQRATDLLLSGSIEAIGTVVAVLVPLLLLGWMMQRFWQTDSVQDIDEMIVMSAEASHLQPTVSTTEIWQNLKPVSIANGRHLPEAADDNSWSQDA